MSQKDEIFAYAAKTYGAAGDHPFARDLVSTVLRHEQTRKWYALFMRIDRSKLGDFPEEEVDMVNLKCDPYLAASLWDERSIFPSYHMNRRSWITVVLDGSVPTEKICSLLDLSFDLTGKGDPRIRRNYVRDWIIPSNVSQFDVLGWLSTHETITWHASKSMQVGDRVFLYLGVPYSAILIQFVIEEMNLRAHCDGSTDTRPIMLLKPVARYLPEELNRPVLREHGITTVRGARSMPESLSRYIDQVLTKK